MIFGFYNDPIVNFAPMSKPVLAVLVTVAILGVGFAAEQASEEDDRAMENEPPLYLGLLHHGPGLRETRRLGMHSLTTLRSVTARRRASLR